MWKNSIAAVIVTLILGIGYYAVTSFIGAEKVTEPIESNEKSEVIESASSVDKVVEEKEEAEEKIKPKMGIEYPLGMAESRIQNAIHHMSHSKVDAKSKWGHLEPTQERITSLLDVLKQNPKDYEHSELYISILEKWQEGDFSRAVLDHNRIWDLQGGTIGKASRLLSEQEAAKYNKEHFE